jgi:hypothetical protein
VGSGMKFLCFNGRKKSRSGAASLGWVRAT